MHLAISKSASSEIEDLGEDCEQRIRDILKALCNNNLLGKIAGELFPETVRIWDFSVVCDRTKYLIAALYEIDETNDRILVMKFSLRMSSPTS